jgi:hypothetical protein
VDVWIDTILSMIATKSMVSWVLLVLAFGFVFKKSSSKGHDLGYQALGEKPSFLAAAFCIKQL